ncbi:paraben-hydrolyzing esterase precursor [Delitschia confertaspora ATCC 74209]|uniref:Carboxylic ester hydrolase n=1 Tax=Delitschia confertaspora ATCC 74209 TaxID=1513339 RepID=A0A9P4MKJ9_9PLEO|nr:paraben-hydrolyzing esterase precursor [Delitschia confertaspora ATCC 74209]
MKTIRPTEPYLRDLEYRGFVEGLTIKDKDAKHLCHYFGGLPYALPPTGLFRWQKPRPLPSCFRYGTRTNPGRYTGGTGICPQPDDDINPECWDEDCLQCNIWMPVGEPPKEGWPVFFWIHGGFLQFGSPNEDDLVALLSETNFKAIVVMPAYRLNLFGFLASRDICENSNGVDLAANLGFWDQRLALEWTHKNISYFGGDASNITVGGYSAGSHSTFHQLAYDLGVSDSKSIIRRAIMFSNGPGLQPKSLDEAETQFNELLSVLSIPLSLPASEKLAKLRATEPRKLILASQKMKYHQFRAFTDGNFVRHGLFNDLDNGSFARQMKRRGIHLLIGDCRDEHFVYGEWRTPENSLESMVRRFEADYPLAAVEAIVDYYCPNGKLPDGWKDWQDAFGRIYANIQVHALERGMINQLIKHGAGSLIHRYRIEWRASCVWAPKEWGVTHGTDIVIWFWGNGAELKKNEKKVVKEAFHDCFVKFVGGEEMEWGTEGPLDLRVLTPEGTVVCRKDKMLREGVELWEILKSVGATGQGLQMRL